MDLRSLMSLGRREPGEVDPFTAMRREMDRLMEGLTRSGGLAGFGGGVGSMKVDMKDTPDAIEIHAELPGVDQKDVDVQLADGVLTIRGEKKQSKEQKEQGYYLMERSYGSFFRQIPVPIEVEEERIEAGFANGVLSITMPKTPKADTRARRIQIKGQQAGATTGSPGATGTTGEAAPSTTSSE